MYNVARVSLGLIIALILSIVSSYPPTIPMIMIKAYDYPIIRLLLLTGIFYLSTIIPDLIIPIAIVYAILSDDIVKTSSREQFQGSPINSYPLINLLPGASEIHEARQYSEKHVSVDSIKDTLQKLEAQISDLSRVKK
jgi:hypothetical protein